VVLLSPGCSFVDDVLAGLEERGGAVDSIVIYRPPAPRRPWMLARWLVRRAHLRLGRSRRSGPRVVFTGALNGRRMSRDLDRLRPDVLVLARCGLLAPHVLAIPREGVVNVHPGLLPWIRNANPLANSLARHVPLGATAFRVDAGIDTGRLLERRLVPVAGGETAEGLRGALYRLWVEMTAELALAAARGLLPAGTPQAGRFPLCRPVSDPEGIAAMEDAVRRGVPKQLFERWKLLCGPRETLPPDADADFLPRPS
jgi:hypothetical protein